MWKKYLNFIEVDKQNQIYDKYCESVSIIHW